jgi:hypothetical protein
MGKDGQGDRPEAGEAGEQLLFVGSGRAMLLLDVFQGADGGKEIAGLGLFAAGERNQRCGCWQLGRNRRCASRLQQRLLRQNFGIAGRRRVERQQRLAAWRSYAGGV